MRILAGSSGFSYEQWRGSFYPADIAASAMLRHYARQLPAVELNNTFYRMPTARVVGEWAEQVGDGFRFAIKAPRRITHISRLRDVEQPVGHLLDATAALGQRLGPLLFQLPPNLSKHLDRLRALLDLVPPDRLLALEPRHPSWLDDEVAALLAARGAALVTVDRDDGDEPALTPVARFGYLRLRRTAYDDRALERWLERIRQTPWEAAWVFFKHEDAGTGPRLAARLLELAAR
jgi:uncharacterized protein YecE (DUF72 family)